MKRLTISGIITITALAGTGYLSEVVAGGMGMGSNRGPGSGYGAGPGSGYGPGYGYGPGPGYGPAEGRGPGSGYGPGPGYGPGRTFRNAPLTPGAFLRHDTVVGKLTAYQGGTLFFLYVCFVFLPEILQGR